MKKIIAITAILAIALTFTACFGCNSGEGTVMNPNAMIMGEIYEINGNTLTLRIVEIAGGAMGGGQTVVRTNDDGEIIEVESYPEYDGDIEYDDEYDAPSGRIAGADAETDLVRTGDGGQGGGMVIAGDEMPELRFTGEVQTITLPNGVEIINGVGGDGLLTDISTLRIGDIVFLMYNSEGVLDSARLMPFRI